MKWMPPIVEVIQNDIHPLPFPRLGRPWHIRLFLLRLFLPLTPIKRQEWRCLGVFNHPGRAIHETLGDISVFGEDLDLGVQHKRLCGLFLGDIIRRHQDGAGYVSQTEEGYNMYMYRFCSIC